MAEDNWQTAYEATERLHRSILAEVNLICDLQILFINLLNQLGDRGRLPRSSVGYNQSTQRLRSLFSYITPKNSLVSVSEPQRAF